MTSKDHSRSRPYRSEPSGWRIQDISIDFFKQLLLKRHPQGGPPCAVVFDLDGTLFDTGFRTVGIIQEWLERSETKSQQPVALRERAEHIAWEHAGYSVLHAFENAGFNLENPEELQFVRASEQYWKSRFFDGEALLLYDKPYPGVQALVQWLEQNDFVPVYLTGRGIKRMHEGTKQQLRNAGLPFTEERLFLKSHAAIEDAVFKAESILEIGRRWPVVANFENEYVNLARMAHELPDILHVIVDSQHSGKDPGILEHPVYRIDSFLATP